MAGQTSNNYIALNKPYLMMSQFSISGNKPTLSDLGISFRNVYPVGRLDHDSEGLLILSNDKYLIHKLTSHNNFHEKTYFVQVENEINTTAINNLEKGVEINVDGKIYLTKPAKVQIISEPENLWERNPPIRFRANIPTSWIKITITDGKNRQVRKMTACVGFPTLRLIRYSIENLTLEGIKPGNYIEINKDAIYKKLKIK